MSRRCVQQLADGESIEEVYLVSDRQVRANKNGAPYLQVDLRDRTGVVNAKLWNVAEAVAGAGAEAVTCINTMLGFAYDPETRRPSLAAGGGGLSGRAIHPIAVRAVHDVHDALPELAIIGVGGVASGWDAAELLLDGASAVQVGTASFANPSATADVQRELAEWMHEQGIRGTHEIGALA